MVGSGVDKFEIHLNNSKCQNVTFTILQPVYTNLWLVVFYHSD